MKTKFLTKEEAIKQVEWKLIDAAGVPVGRLASKVAAVIRGKHKVTFTPHNNCGDFVVVINAEKAVFTGKKLQKKVYYHHTGFIGGIKERKASDLMQTKPEEVIEMAVHGMLPKNTLGHQMKKRLRVVRGAEHRFNAHKPQLIS
jgi:large subunit ribosomal protein L13